MWFIDLATLVLVILAGLQLGIVGVFGFDAAQTFLGGYTQLLYLLMGLSSVWQLCRQQFH